MNNLMSVSSGALYTAFVLYLIATLFFGATIRDKNTTGGKKGFVDTLAISLTILGFISQLIYFITRWIAGGHAPVSNMFEFVTFLGMSLVLALIIIYASMFPSEVSPLVPSLQSNWLFIHVITVSISQGILAVSFVAGLIYLIRQVNQTERTKKTTWLELILFSLVIALGFVVITT